MFRKEKGFTLIELLIVIAVIGILAAAILPRFIAFDTDAKRAADKGSLSSLRAALTLYRAKVGNFPLTGDRIEVLISTAGSGPYIERIPVLQMTSYGGGTAGGRICTVGLTTGSGVGWIYLSDTDTITPLDGGESTTW